MLPSERIRLLVDDTKMPYTELEKKTGISKSALQRYASGTTKKIPIDAVEAIASAFNVSASYIMGWEEEEPATTEDDGLTEKQREVREALMSLDDPDLQKQALDYIDYLKSKRNS